MSKGTMQHHEETFLQRSSLDIKQRRQQYRPGLKLWNLSTVNFDMV
jgi:hypothetical protein